MRKLTLFLLIAVCASPQQAVGPAASVTQTTLAVSNDTTTGTHANRLAVLSTAGAAIQATTSSTTGILGIVVTGAGASGSANIAQTGIHACDFDGATTAGDYVVASTTTGGMCHDTGSSTYPSSSVSVIGKVVSTGGTGVYVLPGAPVASAGGGGGSITAVNAGNGLSGGGSSGAVTPSLVTPLIVGTGANTNIAATVANCPTAPTQCFITIPANYAGGDSVTGFNVDYTKSDTSAYGSNVFITDLRNGHTDFVNNNLGYTVSNQAAANAAPCVIYALQPTSSNSTCWLSKVSILFGGKFLNGNTSNYPPWHRVVFAKTYGQIIPEEFSVDSYAPSDTLLRSDSVNSLGGLASQPYAEGQEPWDQLTYQGTSNQGTVEWAANTSSSGVGLNTLSVGNATQGAGTLAEGRIIVDITAGGTANTVTAVTGYDFSGTPDVVTLGTAVSASTAITTLASAVSPTGSAQVITPGAYSVGSASNFTVGSYACVADPSNEPEVIKIASQSGSSVGLNFLKPHATGAILSTGPMCGKYLEFNADRVTSATHPEITLSSVYVTGTIHTRNWQIIACPTSTTCQIAVQGKGYWRGISYASAWSSSNNAVTIWNGARVQAISTTPGQDAGYTGGTFSVADNTMTVAPGDTLQEFVGAGVSFQGGNHNVVHFTSNFTGAGGAAWGFSVWGIMNSGDTGLSFYNQTPLSYYQLFGGTYLPATALLDLGGQGLYNARIQYPGQYADIAVQNCFGGSVGCQNIDHLGFQFPDAAGSDAYGYNMATSTPFISAQNQTLKWRFTSSGLLQPTHVFSALAACTSAIEGSESPVTDSTANAWGATVTGGGTNHVKAYCDGTSWTVEAK